MRRSVFRLLAPFLALLLPFALLVGLGVSYMSLVKANRERSLQEKARLLLRSREADLAARVEDTAGKALDLLAPPLEKNGKTLPFPRIFARDLAPQAEAVEGVTGVFLMRGEDLLYPSLPPQATLDEKNAEFPFESLGDPRAQEEWERVSGLVDDFVRTLSFDWALEEIRKARRAKDIRDPDFPLFLDYLEATVLRARKDDSAARKAFLSLAEKLSRRKPRPGQETLLCLYEAARLAPPETKKKELLELAREIARGDWNDVPGKFLQFIFFDRILADLDRMKDPAVQVALEEEIKPMEAAREAQRAFGLSMAFLGKALVLSELKKTLLPKGETHYLDMEGSEGPLVLAFRVITGPEGPEMVEGAALDLASLASEVLGREEAKGGSDPEALVVSLRTPRNLPVGNPAKEREGEAPPVASLDLGPPLQGFRLLARLKDPAAALRREALDRWKLGLYLAALTLMAGTGAVFLGRNVKRELELARLKADFVSRVTHDLKTPLSLIRLYAETLTMGRARGREEREKCGRVILSECDRLTAMVDKILDFSSHLDRREFTYRPGRIRAAKVVEEALQAFRPKAESQSVKLSWKLEGDPEAFLDEEAFRRCVFNLLDNAVKFGGGEVEVFLGEQGDSLVLEVRDRGPGIPPGERRKVLRPFYRGAGAGEKRGSGLGLSLVQHFIMNHDGAIQILDRAGGGAVIRVTFPKTRAGDDENPRREVDP